MVMRSAVSGSASERNPDDPDGLRLRLRVDRVDRLVGFARGHGVPAIRRDVIGATGRGRDRRAGGESDSYCQYHHSEDASHACLLRHGGRAALTLLYIVGERADANLFQTT